MIRELHFPTPVYILDIQDKGVTRTNVKGWHSTTDMHEKP